MSSGARSSKRGNQAVVTRLRAVAGEQYPDWEAVYRDNVGLVHRVIFAKVGNRPDAEDLTTEVFLAVLRPLRLPAAAGEVRVTCWPPAVPCWRATGRAGWAC